MAIHYYTHVPCTECQVYHTESKYTMIIIIECWMNAYTSKLNERKWLEIVSVSWKSRTPINVRFCTLHICEYTECRRRTNALKILCHFALIYLMAFFAPANDSSTSTIWNRYGNRKHLAKTRTKWKLLWDKHQMNHFWDQLHYFGYWTLNCLYNVSVICSIWWNSSVWVWGL